MAGMESYSYGSKSPATASQAKPYGTSQKQCAKWSGREEPRRNLRRKNLLPLFPLCSRFSAWLVKTLFGRDGVPVGRILELNESQISIRHN